MASISRAPWGLPLDPVIAIDGQAGSGKSTVSALIGAHFGLPVLNTGLYFRAAALLIGRRFPGKAREIPHAHDPLGPVSISIEGERVWVDDEELTQYLRDQQVVSILPVVSAHPMVRERLLAMQRAWVQRQGPSVIEGRDIGTVVFPRAFFKTYLVASDEVRIARRPEERTKVLERDRLDSTRKIAPSVAADDAKVIDTTNLAIDEVCDHIISLVEYRVFELNDPSSLKP